MKLLAYDNNYKPIKLEATDQKVSLAIKHPETGDILVCNWYTYKRQDGQPCNIEPFVYFCNDGLALFCNDISKTNYESLSAHGKNLLNLYYGELLHSGYRDDFRRFIFSNTTPEDDDDVSTIKFKLGKTISFDSNDDGTLIEVTGPGNKTHFQLMTALFRKAYEKRILAFVNLCRRRMKLVDKVASCTICDPDESNYLEGRHAADDTLSVGTFGCNYYTFLESDYETADHEANYTSVIRYTPFVYFMSPERQKILIIHELVHTKIGSAHAHDEYFWYLVEFYSGLSREKDLGWSPDTCAQDTARFDSNSNTTCAELIREHKRWLASGRKGGQW